MTGFTDADLTIYITDIDFDEVLSCWKWRIANIKSVIFVSCLGDVFYAGTDEAIYWLQTDCGDLTKVADNLTEFKQYLHDDAKVDNWFLPGLINKLKQAGKVLQLHEVYSYQLLPVLGGAYSAENIKPTNIGTHLAFTGLIFEQIKDLPDGTKVSIKVKE